MWPSIGLSSIKSSLTRIRSSFKTSIIMIMLMICETNINLFDPNHRLLRPCRVARHDRMVELVAVHAHPAGSRERTLLARRIEATDRQIDRLVYELYGLTEEEIGIVEAASQVEAFDESL